MSADCRSDMASDHVGVHVIEAAVLADGDRCDDRDIVRCHQIIEQGTIDARDMPDAPEVRACLLGHDHSAIGTGNAHGEISVLVQRLDQLLVDLAHENGANQVHGLRRGDALPVLELDGDFHEIHRPGDGLTATMDDDGVHADDFKQHDVAHDIRAQLLVDHSRSTIFDDDGFTGDVLNPRQRLYEDLSCLR